MPPLARIRLMVLAWAGASLFFTAVLMVSALGHKPLGFALYANAVHFGLWVLALPLLWNCIQRFPLNRGKAVGHVGFLLLAVTVVGTLVMLSEWTIVFNTFFPERSSYPSFGSFLQSELVRFLPGDILIGIVLVVALEGWRVWLGFQAERTRATDLERQLAVARLDALRMQLHPHFLFNTLHTIAGLIAEQPPIARRMVIELGDLLRLTLKDTLGTVPSAAWPRNWSLRTFTWVSKSFGWAIGSCSITISIPKRPLRKYLTCCYSLFSRMQSGMVLPAPCSSVKSASGRIDKVATFAFPSTMTVRCVHRP